MFNQICREMKKQELICHPQTKNLPLNQWETIIWNTAWLAANAADGYKTEVVT